MVSIILYYKYILNNILFSDVLIGYQSDSIVLFTICFLIILGGLGYFVLIEIYENRRFSKRFTIHTRIMLYGTVILIVFGMVLFLSIEPLADYKKQPVI